MQKRAIEIPQSDSKIDIDPVNFRKSPTFSKNPEKSWFNTQPLNILNKAKQMDGAFRSMRDGEKLDVSLINATIRVWDLVNH